MVLRGIDALASGVQLNLRVAVGANRPQEAADQVEGRDVDDAHDILGVAEVPGIAQDGGGEVRPAAGAWRRDLDLRHRVDGHLTRTGGRHDADITPSRRQGDRAKLDWDAGPVPE